MNFMRQFYKKEIAEAIKFTKEHREDADFIEFMTGLRQCEAVMPHDERWSRIYDYIKAHYPDTPSYVIVGLSYWIESE